MRTPRGRPPPGRAGKKGAVAFEAQVAEALDAEALGREIAADERDRVEAGAPSVPTLYFGLDGTGVPVRGAETEGRAGKRKDGAAKTREAKLAVVWSAERTGADGLPARDPGSVTGSAAIESAAARDTNAEPAPFARRVLREVARRGFGDAERRVVIGDGAEWIWNIADEHFPGAVQIVDVFHAAEHLFDIARAVYGDDNDLAHAWARKRRVELLAGDFVLEAMKEELDAVMEKYAAAELASADGSESAGALLDRRIRRTALSSARRGLEPGYAGDRSYRGGGRTRLYGPSSCCIIASANTGAAASIQSGSVSSPVS